MEKYLYIALFAPLVSSLFGALFATTPKRQFVGVIASILLGISWFASMKLLFYVDEEHIVKSTLFNWISAGNFKLLLIRIGILLLFEIKLPKFAKNI